MAGPRPQLASSSRGSSASACHPWGYDDIDIGFNEQEGLRDSGELEELDSVALDNIGNELARAGDVVAVSSEDEEEEEGEVEALCLDYAYRHEADGVTYRTLVLGGRAISAEEKNVGVLAPDQVGDSYRAVFADGTEYELPGMLCGPGPPKAPSLTPPPLGPLPVPSHPPPQPLQDAAAATAGTDAVKDIMGTLSQVSKICGAAQRLHPPPGCAPSACKSATPVMFCAKACVP